MRFLVYLSLYGFAMTCTTLLMATGVSSQSLTYNADVMTKYVQASQQLRREMYKSSLEIATRATNLFNTLSVTNTNVASLKSAGAATILAFRNQLLDISSYMKIRYAPTAVVWGTNILTSVNNPFLTDVHLDTSMAYDKQTATVPMSGVYAVEYRVQMNYYSYASTDLTVFGPDGSQLHDINYQFYMSCNPTQEMFSLQVGSVVKVSTLVGYSGYGVPPVHFYMVGRPSATQLNIRFISPLN